jgi:nitroreductase
MQPWEFVVVKKPELREKIVGYIKEYWRQAKSMEGTRESWQGKPWITSGLLDAGMDFTTAPVFIILFGDTRTKAGLPMGLRYDPSRCHLIFISALPGRFAFGCHHLGWLQWVSAITFSQLYKGFAGIRMRWNPTRWWLDILPRPNPKLMRI